MKIFQCILVQTFIIGSLSSIAAAPPPGPAGLQNRPASTEPVELRGKVIRKDGKYLLLDAKNKRTVELRGSDIAQWAGKTVIVQGETIAGGPSSAGVTKVILVSKIGIATASRRAGAAVPAATSGKLSGAALGTIGVAAAAAGTVGGLYASGAIGEDQPVSRP